MKKDKLIQLRISEKLHKEFRKYCKHRNLTMSEMIIEYIETLCNYELKCTYNNIKRNDNGRVKIMLAIKNIALQKMLNKIKPVYLHKLIDLITDIDTLQKEKHSNKISEKDINTLHNEKAQENVIKNMGGKNHVKEKGH